MGSGSAFHNGGPGSVVSDNTTIYSAYSNDYVANGHFQLIGFIIVGCMLLFTVQALGELAVLYPVNGAFFSYGCRFIDEAWYGLKIP